MSDDRQFHQRLDNFVRDKIRKLIRKDPRYFSERVNAFDLLKYMDVMPPESMERIKQTKDREGNTRAVEELTNEMVKYGKFAYSFLKGLVGTYHQEIAEKILSGLSDTDFGMLGTEEQIQFLRDLQVISSPPPPYDSSEAEETIRADQYNEFQKARGTTRGTSYVSQSEISYTNDINHSVNGDSEISNGRTDEMNIVPSTSTRDGNIFTLDNQQNEHPVRDLSHNVQQQLQQSFSTTMIDNAKMNPTDRPEEIYLNSSTANAVGNHYFQTASYFGATISDIHESQMCISDDESETFPKELSSGKGDQCQSTITNSQVCETVVEKEEIPAADNKSVESRETPDLNCDIQSSGDPSLGQLEILHEERSSDGSQNQPESCFSGSGVYETVIRKEEIPVADNKFVQIKKTSATPTKHEEANVQSQRLTNPDSIFHGWSLVVCFFATVFLTAGVVNKKHS